MTVQEAKTLINMILEEATSDEHAVSYVTGCQAEELKIAIECMEELEQYRALGTPKEIKIREVSSAQLGKAYLSNLTELREYQSLGTVEELKEAREKQVAKSPTLEGDGYCPEGNLVYDTWICPNCEEHYEIDYDDYDYCPKCGQKINREIFY